MAHGGGLTDMARGGGLTDVARGCGRKRPTRQSENVDDTEGLVSNRGAAPRTRARVRATIDTSIIDSNARRCGVDQQS